MRHLFSKTWMRGDRPIMRKEEEKQKKYAEFGLSKKMGDP